MAATKQEQVYALLRERILDGEYGPGYRLVIDRIAAAAGVSALPVREAVRRLEAEGLVVFRPNSGAQVSPADPALWEETMTVLAVLEGYATAAAAPALAAGALEALGRETDAMAACLESFDALGFADANRRFHHVLHEACGNAALLDLLRSTERRLDALRRTVFTRIPYRGSDSIAEHRRLIALLRAGADAGEIERAAREHKLATVAAFRAWQAAVRAHEADALREPAAGAPVVPRSA